MKHTYNPSYEKIDETVISKKKKKIPVDKLDRILKETDGLCPK